MTGIFEQIVEDHFDQGTSVTHYRLKTPGGNFTLLFPHPQMGQSILSGSQVSLTGQVQGSQLIVDTLPAVHSDQGPLTQKLKANMTILQLAAAVPANGVRKVAVVLVNYSDNQTQPVSPTVAAQLLTSANQFFQESSDSHLSVNGNVFGYVQLPLSIQVNCSNDPLESISSAGLAAVQKAGFDLTSYDSYAFLGPTVNNCLVDYASIGGIPGTVLVRASDNVSDPLLLEPVFSHELGHNLGLRHANSIDCGSVVYIYPDTTCKESEYGNLWDDMGSGAGQFNAVFKELLGWINPVTTSATGLYGVAPFEALPGSLPPALRITPDALGTDSYYIEYRQPVGFFDSKFFYRQVYNGPLFNLGGNPSRLLNMHPGVNVLATGFTTPELDSGEHFVDYANRFSVSTVSADTAALTLRILVPGVDTPTLLFTNPSGGDLLTGVTAISIDALDRTGITKVELYKDGALLGTQTSAPYQFNWDTSKEIPGNHTLTGKAYNAAGNTYSQSILVAANTTVKPPAPQLATVAQATGVPGTAAMAPGSLVTIYGSQLADETVPASTVPLPFSLGNVSVMFNGVPAPLLFVNGNQINAQVPWNVLPVGVTSGTAALVVTSLGISSSPQTVRIAPFSPGIFTLQYGTGQAVAVNSDGTLAAAASSVPGQTTHPAAPGDSIVILGSGLGAVSPAIENGANASDGLRTTITTPRVLVGGVSAQVTFSGLSPQFVGVNQINIVVPRGVPSGDAVPLQIRVAGITTSDKLTMAIR